jgi:hypothetical protein
MEKDVRLELCEKTVEDRLIEPGLGEVESITGPAVAMS